MRKRLAMLLAALALAIAPARAQQSGDIPPPEKLVAVTAAPVAVGAGSTATASLVLDVAKGWHVNANPASPDYMVATVVEIEGAAGISAGAPRYPAGRGLKLGFEQSEVSVFDGRATVEVPITVSEKAATGEHALKGKVRFQACNDQLCLAPVSVPFTLRVAVSGGTRAGAATPGLRRGSGTPAPGAGAPAGEPQPAAGAAARGQGSHTAPPGSAARPQRFDTAPPPGGGSPALDNPLARALDRGGFGAFLALFLIGLALNLTPCVYPMMGVTVSIFGGRRSAPPLQVFGLALLYVLGMATMYSALGVIVAFTGGLFGGFLQNPLVPVGIGLLLAAMSLSMFGLYEIQLPAAIRERAGAVNATTAAGVFFSGLVVGVVAAPCVGPPVVALLAIVAAKADPWFGFASFFTLALGLGLPYLVLGTFSNLLQTLPRSGDWMEWVKKLFGVLLLSIAAFYLMLGVAPGLAAWVVPVALVAGGGYLGFIDTHADRRPLFRVFKRVAGAAAVAGGLAIVATTPRNEVSLAAFTPERLDAALKSGKVAMIDFSADWCVPCHELERNTFTDRRVIGASRQFATFKADLTRYDSPEAEAWRKQYGIAGVPTVLFIAPGGREVKASRVEGFLSPDRFLERMALAARAGQEAER